MFAEAGLPGRSLFTLSQPACLDVGTTDGPALVLRLLLHWGGEPNPTNNSPKAKVDKFLSDSSVERHHHQPSKVNLRLRWLVVCLSQSQWQDRQIVHSKQNFRQKKYFWKKTLSEIRSQALWLQIDHLTPTPRSLRVDNKAKRHASSFGCTKSKRSQRCVSPPSRPCWWH